MYYKSTPMYEIKAMALKNLAIADKKKLNYEPIHLLSTKIATSWWGIAWCDNLESYAYFENRLPRGKSYVKNDCVIDLKIEECLVTAIVQGSRKKPYSVEVGIKKLPKKNWEKIEEICKAKINSLEELANGEFPKEFEVLFKDKEYGLFPSIREIDFDCSCPDGASVCKHVAAVLYAVGSKLDTDPLLFFKLRGINCDSLIRKSVEDNINTIIKNAKKIDDRIIDEEEAKVLFNI